MKTQFVLILKAVIDVTVRQLFHRHHNHNYNRYHRRLHHHHRLPVRKTVSISAKDVHIMKHGNQKLIHVLNVPVLQALLIVQN